MFAVTLLTRLRPILLPPSVKRRQACTPLQLQYHTSLVTWRTIQLELTIFSTSGQRWYRKLQREFHFSRLLFNPTIWKLVYLKKLHLGKCCLVFPTVLGHGYTQSKRSHSPCRISTGSVASYITSSRLGGSASPRNPTCCPWCRKTHSSGHRSAQAMNPPGHKLCRQLRVPTPRMSSRKIGKSTSVSGTRLQWNQDHARCSTIVTTAARRPVHVPTKVADVNHQEYLLLLTDLITKMPCQLLRHLCVEI